MCWQFAVAGSLGYECHHQQNLKTMRGAKSNALFLTGANWDLACPYLAPIICAKSCAVASALGPDAIAHTLYHVELKLRTEVSGFLEIWGAGRGILFLGPNPNRVINELQRFL